MSNYILHMRTRINKGMLCEILNEMKWIYRYSIHYKGAVVWYIFLGFLGTVMGLGTGIVSKYIIDAVTGYDNKGIVLAAAAYVGMSCFRIIMNGWSGRVSAKIRIMVTQEIRTDVFGQILMSDWESLAEYHSGDLLNRLNSDVNTVATSILGWIPDFITSLVQFSATLLLILYYDPIMAILALISAPVILVMSRFFMKKMRNHNVKMLEINSEVMAFNEETFQNLQYIKSFALMQKYKDLFRCKQEKYKEEQLSYNKFSIYTSSVMSLLGMVVTSLCFGWGVYRLWSGAITYGTMTLFVQQAGNLSLSFSNLVNTVPNAIGAATSAGRIMNITGLPVEEQTGLEKVEIFRNHISQTEGVGIHAEKISFRYKNGREVLSEASLCAEPGEVIALVGTSGEGKTTMLKILLGLVKIHKGRIWIESGNLEMDLSSSTRKLFAYVPQGNTMMSGTIRENLLLLNENATEEEIWCVLREVCAEEFVRKLPNGLDTYLKERGGGLSEGQLQRLSIARALLYHAPILLLDEATSALDADTERRLLQNVMHSSRKVTCIVTTHRPGALMMCSRVYRVEDQTIIQVDKEII